MYSVRNCDTNKPPTIAYPSGWRRYLYSTNHKDIGTMYFVFAICAGLIGGISSVVIRMELQQPGLQVNADGTTTDLQTLGGLGQMACASHNDPCRLSFIGDYFGLAISQGNIYTLSVSTHYPSIVKASDGSTLYYQQQVLGTISRASLGI